MPASGISENGWKTVIDLNLNSTFLLSQEVFNRSFEPQKRGVIVNIIANMWSGFPVMSHTGAARAAVHNLTQSLAVEWSKFGVRVLSVAPGTILSSGLDSCFYFFLLSIFLFLSIILIMNIKLKCLAIYIIILFSSLYFILRFRNEGRMKITKDNEKMTRHFDQ